MKQLKKLANLNSRSGTDEDHRPLLRKDTEEDIDSGAPTQTKPKPTQAESKQASKRGPSAVQSPKKEDRKDSPPLHTLDRNQFEDVWKQIEEGPQAVLLSKCLWCYGECPCSLSRVN